MADPKKSTAPKAKTKKAKGPKFSARLVKGDAVIKVRTAFKFHTSTYEAASFYYPDGDAAPSGKGSRAANDLIETAGGHTSFTDAEAAAKRMVADAVKLGYEPQEKPGKRTAIGWEAVA